MENKCSEDDVFVSIVSFIEIAIKRNLKRIVFPESFDDLVRIVCENGWELVPVSTAHLEKLVLLPEYKGDKKKHGDPADRLLIATAQSEDATFLTRDEKAKHYNVKYDW